MNDTHPTTGPIEIVLRTSQWREVAAAADQLPTHIDNPGLDALMHELSGRGLLDDAA
jgi:hypothetical protein